MMVYDVMTPLCEVTGGAFHSTRTQVELIDRDNTSCGVPVGAKGIYTIRLTCKLL